VRCVAGGDVGTISGAPPREQPTSRGAAPIDVARRQPAPPPKSSGKVFCKFKFIIGTAWKERSYCTSGSVSQATDSCNASARGMGADVAPCWCTDDAQYIGSRC
jgi:hypothetical protein